MLATPFWVKRNIGLVVVFALILSSCGGGGGGGSTATPTPTPTSHVVDISWTANREAAVNRAGGGYTVAISGQPAINVPWVSGATAPTTTSVTLMTGSYSATVTAYSALTPPGGVSGSTSLPSSTLTISVP